MYESERGFDMLLSIIIQFSSSFLCYLGFSLQTVEALENLIPILDTPTALCYATRYTECTLRDLWDADAVWSRESLKQCGSVHIPGAVV